MWFTLVHQRRKSMCQLDLRASARVCTAQSGDQVPDPMPSHYPEMHRVGNFHGPFRTPEEPEEGGFLGDFQPLVCSHDGNIRPRLVEIS
jgi:hypothetical protein